MATDQSNKGGHAMSTTNGSSGTGIHEVADGIYRVSTPVGMGSDPAGFTFNQYLVVDEEPLLFHTGPRGLFPGIREAVARVLPVERLRWIGFSHVEADECGSLNDWLRLAPRAVPIASRVAVMTSVGDLADRSPRALADGEGLSLGRRRVTWLDTPHLPHGWDSGLLFEESTRTLLAGDLFTQPGSGAQALTTADILGPSEALRSTLDYYAHGHDQRHHLERLARLAPTTLACMHGSAWQGDGAALLLALADALEASREPGRARVPGALA
jgi:flavorubredoxin